MFSPTLVHDFLKSSARRLPEKTALVFQDERWSYKKVDRYSDYLAVAMLNGGVERHDRVVIFMDDCSQTVISIYGILKAGAVFVVLNGSMKALKLNHILKDSGATLLITHTKKAKVVRDALAGADSLTNIIWVGDLSNIPPQFPGISLHWEQILEVQEKGQPYSLNQVGPRIIDSDLAALVYTSGSTGVPKGVMSSHRSMISVSRSVIQYLENTADDIVLNVLPLSFGYGLYQVIMTFMFSGTIVLEPNFVFPIKTLQQIEKEKVTGFPVVPTVIALLLRMRGLGKSDLASLRYLTSSGASLPVDHIRKLRAFFPKVKVYSMYGLTECKRVSYLAPEELDKRPTSVGKAIPNCEVMIMEDGCEVSPGEVGELVVRGSNLMNGYWNAPELTAEVFKGAGFAGETILNTGDLFRRDEQGFLYFIGRKDDMIKTKGERVSPAEIENVLHRMEGVTEAFVVGVPDPILGQAIKAFVVCEPDKRITSKDVSIFCSSNLEVFMVPKYVEFLDRLPKTSSGKIDRRVLIASHQDEEVIPPFG